jgi:hypothetical protein
VWGHDDDHDSSSLREWQLAVPVLRTEFEPIHSLLGAGYAPGLLKVLIHGSRCTSILL